MGDFEPSEGTISDTSAKFWVISRPSYLGWIRAGPDPTVEDTYPDPQPLPAMTYPEEPLTEGWELHWSKTYRTPYYYNRSLESAIGSGPQPTRTVCSGQHGCR